MHYTKTLGIAAPELGWVPSPTFILRRSAILEHFKSLAPGAVLEIGCGPGAILHELARRGYRGLGIEVSEKSRIIASHFLESFERTMVQETLPPEQKGTFDFLLSFEVLEHIEKDVEALTEWLEYLKPGGMVMLSVPAGKSKWNVTDLCAGHYRRYDREDLISLVNSAGLELIEIYTYGWPFTWLIERLRLWARLRQMENTGEKADKIRSGDIERSKASGNDRRIETRLYRLYGSGPGRLLFMLAARFQRLFYRTDLGISYVALARKTMQP